MSRAGRSVTLGERTVNGAATLTTVKQCAPPRRYGAGMASTRPAMDEPLKDRNLLSLADLGPADVAHVLALARRLQQMHAAGADRPLLQGRIVGVLGDGPVDPCFGTAVQQLGASLAAVSPGLVATGDTGRLERTARWLGRLYDAVDCVDPLLAARLARTCPVPVLGGLSAAQHPFQALGARLLPEPADPRVMLIKALLVATLH
jgi:ornithine carbamoyltransferase